MIPKVIQRLIDDFQKLPGIGPKTAQRLAFYILRMPVLEVEKFAQDLTYAKSGTIMCSICKNIDEVNPCSLCTDDTRSDSTLAVVSTPLDLVSMERAGFKGRYHVLHGVIDPLNGVGPEELYIDDLIKRIRKILDKEKEMDQDQDVFIFGGEDDKKEPLEIILALSTSLEGESTALYISKLIKSNFSNERIKVTRLARGLPIGGDVEYADEVTLSKALEGRTPLD